MHLCIPTWTRVSKKRVSHRPSVSKQRVKRNVCLQRIHEPASAYHVNHMYDEPHASQVTNALVYSHVD